MSETHCHCHHCHVHEDERVHPLLRAPGLRRIVVALMLSLAGILVVFVWNASVLLRRVRRDVTERKERIGDPITDRIVWISVCTAFFGLVEYLLFYETGKRQFDGNFSWGYFY
ncbi:MAG: hypothetical protein J6T92_08540, partial [Ottowia sp.]|nr:hypothetical protein [Ottowia sp.]